MRVGTIPFVLFGLVFGLAPLSLDAAPPSANRARIFSKVRLSRARVKGLKVASRLDTRAKGGLTVRLDVHNPTHRTVTADLKVDVYARRPSSPMARMIPPPVHHGSRILRVTLRPGARLARTILINKGHTPKKADVTRYYTLVCKAAKKRTRQSQQALRG